MNIFEVNITRQAEEQMRTIAWHIAVELHNPDAAENLINDFIKKQIEGKEPQEQGSPLGS